MILQMLAVGPFASNCYIVGSEKTKEGIIIDPGAEPETILDEVRKLGLKITMIVATHGHVDHIGGVADVKKATQAPFAMHADDVAALPEVSKHLSMLFGTHMNPPQSVDKLLNEGDIIKVGEYSFKVLHTPGHSPGGISLAGNGVVFSGDTLFNYGIGRTDFPGCSYDALMDSIRTKLMTLPDETIVLSGHGPDTTIGTERHGNPWAGDWEIEV
jgi:glyoxylase-like metal-dependent hydrolase (beta-lactamase superfamily II)